MSASGVSHQVGGWKPTLPPCPPMLGTSTASTLSALARRTTHELDQAPRVPRGQRPGDVLDRERLRLHLDPGFVRLGFRVAHPRGSGIGRLASGADTPSLISRANYRQNPDGEGRRPPRYPASAGCRMRGTATDIHTFRCIKCGHAETMFVEAEDAPESPLGSVDIVCPACRQSNRIVKPTGLLIKRVTLELQKSW